MALTRSEQMSRIRGRDTSPELLLRDALVAAGFHPEQHVRTPVGRPDVVFPSACVAVFIDGCEWHGCPDHYVRPRTRPEFWGPKLRGNVVRDRKQTLALEELGWRVVRAWEHAVATEIEAVVEAVHTALRGVTWNPDLSLRVVEVVPIPETDDEEVRYLEDLRDPAVREIVRRRRITTKWSRRKTSR